MTTMNKYFNLIAIVCLAVLIFSGCTTHRTTTKFMATPMESVNEDLSINPEKLTTELNDELMIQDEKRRNMLLDKAKAEAEKGKKPDTQKTEEVK
ncbi:MAG: hypothetical protein NUV86_09015 [Candidatus Scalindua sp.]|nr:hypothetical protein [Candidatus Scalindua sp.]MCR4343901.1 hypothetical protein [Candidatus Scalindua sp.]